MTRDEAEHVIARSCDGKLGYSPDTARLVARESSVRTRERITAYRCVVCGEPVWHVGHLPSVESMALMLEAMRVMHDCAPEPARLPSAHDRRQMRSKRRRDARRPDHAGAA